LATTTTWRARRVRGRRAGASKNRVSVYNDSVFLHGNGLLCVLLGWASSRQALSCAAIESRHERAAFYHQQAVP